MPAQQRRTVPSTAIPSRRESAVAHPVDVKAHRIYHVTHVENLVGILADGAVRARAAVPMRADPHVDIASVADADARASTTVAGRPATAFVPFFLTPDARLWGDLRSGADEPRLLPRATRPVASEFVVLVASIGDALGSASADPSDLAVAVTDDDVAGQTSKVETGIDGVERMIRSLIADPEQNRLPTAELLLADALPFSAVSVVGVANVPMRERVKGLLAAAGHRTRVSAHSPWFEG